MEPNSGIEQVSPLRAFLRGVGSVFNLMPTPERPAFLDRTDAEVLAGDWKAVGDDLRAAMGNYPLPADPETLSPSGPAQPVR